MAVAGFTVMAQRRLRALGMLGLPRRHRPATSGWSCWPTAPPWGSPPRSSGARRRTGRLVRVRPDAAVARRAPHRPLRPAVVGHRRGHGPRRGHRGRGGLVAGARRGPHPGRGRPVGAPAPPPTGPPLRRRSVGVLLGGGLVLLAFADPAPGRLHHRRHRRHRRRAPVPRPPGHPGPRPASAGAPASRSGWPCATWPATRPAPAPRSARSPWPSASPPPSPSARPPPRHRPRPGNLPPTS